MHEDDGKDNVYGGGLIAGIGFVSGVRAMVAANDSGIKGGAAHPMGVEKAIRAQEIALREKLPYVQLVESAGANLMLQAEMFVRGGATFANMARMSAAGIPVVSIVHGSSTVGGAYQTGLADYVVMVRGRSKVFLAGPRCSRPHPARSPATRRSAGRSCTASPQAWANIWPRTTPTRCGSAARFWRASAGALRRPVRARARPCTIRRSCSASCPSTTANPTTCAR